jgi:hypothetical protein
MQKKKYADFIGSIKRFQSIRNQQPEDLPEFILNYIIAHFNNKLDFALLPENYMGEQYTANPER